MAHYNNTYKYSILQKTLCTKLKRVVKHIYCKEKRKLIFSINFYQFFFSINLLLSKASSILQLSRCLYSYCHMMLLEQTNTVCQDYHNSNRRLVDKH